MDLKFERFTPRSDAERRGYQNGRFDAERELADELAEARDKSLTVFGYGLLGGFTLTGAIFAMFCR